MDRVGRKEAHSRDDESDRTESHPVQVRALNANPGAVSDIFTSSNGVAVKLADLMGTKTSSTGELTVRSSNITDSLVDLKDQQDALNARMKVIQDRYYKQFNALDTLLGQLNNTASSLDSWIGQSKKD